MSMTDQTKMATMTPAQATAALDNAAAYCRDVAEEAPEDLAYLSEELRRIAALLDARDRAGGRIMRALGEAVGVRRRFMTMVEVVERALAVVGTEQDPAPQVWRVACDTCGAYEQQGTRPDRCGACGARAPHGVRVQFGGFAGESVSW